jgi:hypothetical protein
MQSLMYTVTVKKGSGKVKTVSADAVWTFNDTNDN